VLDLERFIAFEGRPLVSPRGRLAVRRIKLTDVRLADASSDLFGLTVAVMGSRDLDFSRTDTLVWCMAAGFPSSRRLHGDTSTPAHE